MKPFLAYTTLTLISAAVLQPVSATQLSTKLKEAIDQSSGWGSYFLRYVSPIVLGATAGAGCHWLANSQFKGQQDLSLIITGLVGFCTSSLTFLWQEKSYWNRLGQAAQAFLQGQPTSNSSTVGISPKNGKEWLLAAAVKAADINDSSLFEKILSLENGAVPVETETFSLLPYLTKKYKQQDSRYFQTFLGHTLSLRGAEFTKQSFQTSFKNDQYAVLPPLITNLTHKKTINRSFGGALDAFQDQQHCHYSIYENLLEPLISKKGEFINSSNCKRLLNLSYQDPSLIDLAHLLLKKQNAKGGPALVEVLSNTFSAGDSQKENFLLQNFGTYLTHEHVGKIVIKYAADPSSDLFKTLMSMCFVQGFWISHAEFKTALVAAAQNGCRDNTLILIDAWKKEPNKKFLVSAYSEALAAAVSGRGRNCVWNSLTLKGSVCSIRIEGTTENSQNPYDDIVSALAQSISDSERDCTSDCTSASQGILGKALVEAAKNKQVSIIQTMMRSLTSYLPEQSRINATTIVLQNNCTEAFLSILEKHKKDLTEDLALTFGKIACQKKNLIALEAIVQKVPNKQKLAEDLLPFCRQPLGSETNSSDFSKISKFLQKIQSEKA